MSCKLFQWNKSENVFKVLTLPDYEASWNWKLCRCQEVPLVGCVPVDPGLAVLLVVRLGGEESQRPS